jgi:hypothetical protein
MKSIIPLLLLFSFSITSAADFFSEKKDGLSTDVFKECQFEFEETSHLKIKKDSESDTDDDNSKNICSIFLSPIGFEDWQAGDIGIYLRIVRAKKDNLQSANTNGFSRKDDGSWQYKTRYDGIKGKPAKSWLYKEQRRGDSLTLAGRAKVTFLVTKGMRSPPTDYIQIVRYTPQFWVEMNVSVQDDQYFSAKNIKPVKQAERNRIMNEAIELVNSVRVAPQEAEQKN